LQTAAPGLELEPSATVGAVEKEERVQFTADVIPLPRLNFVAAVAILLMATKQHLTTDHCDLTG
jgi:hypothetical protein